MSVCPFCDPAFPHDDNSPAWEHQAEHVPDLAFWRTRLAVINWMFGEPHLVEKYGHYRLKIWAEQAEIAAHGASGPS